MTDRRQRAGRQNSETRRRREEEKPFLPPCNATPRPLVGSLRAVPQRLQASGSILPPTGICGARPLATMMRSYLNGPPELRRHCPLTSGVLATFFTGPLSQVIGPTIVCRFVLISASRLAAGSCASALRLMISAATSNKEWTKPIGCVHCFPVALV